ncbi:aldose epimerase family protein [Marinobacterium rhizophilum]|uniref:Aldose 1-epimerase n=1 Tax=Marinobacterium rhizophilum TaxID=420402 RepID=A0ABY5HHG9_9GAMM|nr:aldose epimerase family protein [Marinobacterium rhizophilum]UTW10715.1 galactose mutarotase [Marinobacterium rhizophilum]
MPTTELFGDLKTGVPVHRHWLRHGQLSAAILTYGATLQDLRLEGVAHPLVLGATRLDSYLGDMSYFGANVGRVANRLAGGRVSIAGTEHALHLAAGEKHLLHGGKEGLHHQLWHIVDANDTQVTLQLSLADGHMGFPGKLDIRLRYHIQAPATLVLEIEAVSDALTLCNIAHHSYFNLDGGADILDHRLQVDAGHYLPVNAELIPTGQIAPVGGSRFDFRNARPLRDAAPYPGYDHCFCLSGDVQPLRPVARLYSPKSGIRLRLDTTEPGLQIYDGGHINTSAQHSISQAPYGPHAGLALEAQRWPDAPHHDTFPSIALAPGEVYRQTTAWHFEKPA